MVVMVTIKSSFVKSNILETSKDRPNTLPSWKLLEQRVHELVGGGPLTPQTTSWGAKGLDQEGLRAVSLLLPTGVRIDQNISSVLPLLALLLHKQG